MGCNSSREQAATVVAGAGAPAEMKAGDAVVKAEKPEVRYYYCCIIICCIRCCVQQRARE